MMNVKERTKDNELVLLFRGNTLKECTDWLLWKPGLDNSLCVTSDIVFDTGKLVLFMYSSTEVHIFEISDGE